MKQQDATGLLSSIGLRTPFTKIPLVGLVLFQGYQQIDTKHKINKIGNMFLLDREKIIPEMHLRLLGFSYSAFAPFTKTKWIEFAFNMTCYGDF